MHGSHRPVWKRGRGEVCLLIKALHGALTVSGQASKKPDSTLEMPWMSIGPNNRDMRERESCNQHNTPLRCAKDFCRALTGATLESRGKLKPETEVGCQTGECGWEYGRMLNRNAKDYFEILSKLKWRYPNHRTCNIQVYCRATKMLKPINSILQI